jgi:hypothetical protein
MLISTKALYHLFLMIGFIVILLSRMKPCSVVLQRSSLLRPPEFQELSSFSRMTFSTVNDTARDLATRYSSSALATTSHEFRNSLLSWSSSSTDFRYFAACIVTMDDNHFWKEFLAYHYTFLNLYRLIVAVDPRSKTSP